MTRISPGDLVRIAANGRFYYVFVLDKISLFGGQLCFALYRTTTAPLEAAGVMTGPLDGFYETVDFIWAKREDRVTRIATKVNVDHLNRKVTYFKSTHAIRDKAKWWWIYDRSGREIRRVTILSEEEKRYPLHHRIDDTLLTDLVDKRWCPELDTRI